MAGSRFSQGKKNDTLLYIFCSAKDCYTNFISKSFDMKTNLLVAFQNLVKNPILDISSFYQSRNRINSAGEALEFYVKDLFCNSFGLDLNGKIEIYSEVFSYLGNQNNPPDLIIKSGDAIEVKKIESLMSGIALNSSYPKNKLYADSPMITSACRNCENWQEKDLIYAVGVILNGKLKLLVFIYGDCYSASKEVYERIREKISQGVNELPDVEFSRTKELGRVNKVDPLGITYLRIRGMWGIENPIKVFDYIPSLISSQDFNAFAIMTKGKYMSFPEQDRTQLERLASNNSGFSIKDEKIKSPDNPASLINSKILTYTR